MLNRKIQAEKIMVQRGGGNKFAISVRAGEWKLTDISKIVFMGPSEAKKIGIVLDAQPRAMIINTLFQRIYRAK